MAPIPSVSEMLKEIPSGTGQQLFNAVHSQTDPLGSTLFPALDKHIIQSHEVRTLSSLARGDVIEVQGPAASGKTQLLYHLAACCILPKEVFVISSDVHAERALHLNGWGRSAIVCDCDGRWDTRRLHRILVTRLETSFANIQLPPLPHNPNPTISSIALESLSRLHVFRPTSSLQLAATLINLPKYHTEQMANEEIRMLLVDSISSFYWIDRWQAEYSGPPKTHASNALEQVLRYLQAFRLSHGPIIVLTNWGLNPLSSTTSTPFFKQHLTKPFPAPFDNPPRQSIGLPDQLPLNYHITLPFNFVPQLGPDLTRSDCITGHESVEVEVALRDTRRKEVVRRGEVGGYVRIPRTSRGESANAIGTFKFHILENDVVVSEST